ncbi:MAG: hypothetical protein ACK5Z5_08660 [Neisseriaceae bacterium]
MIHTNKYLPRTGVLTKTDMDVDRQVNFVADRYVANFQSQDNTIPPRLVLTKMTNHIEFPKNANVGIVAEKSKISIYVVSQENSWKKINLPSDSTSYSNTYQTIRNMLSNKESFDDNDGEKLLEAFRLDNLVLCLPPISQQMFNSRVIIPISFDVMSYEPLPKHNGQMLSATMELVIKSLGSGKATILLDDTLQRWNFGALSVRHIRELLTSCYAGSLIYGNIIEDFLVKIQCWQKEIRLIDVASYPSIKRTMELINDNNLFCELSKLHSRLWLKKNQATIKKYIDNEKINIISWDELKYEGNFLKYLEQIMTEYDKNINFRDAINKTIDDYLSRPKHKVSKDNKNYKIYWLCALKYLFEECAVFAQLIVEGIEKEKINFHIYPNGETLAIKATRELCYKLYSVTGFYPVKLNFKSKSS